MSWKKCHQMKYQPFLWGIMLHHDREHVREQFVGYFPDDLRTQKNISDEVLHHGVMHSALPTSPATSIAECGSVLRAMGIQAQDI